MKKKLILGVLLSASLCLGIATFNNTQTVKNNVLLSNTVGWHNNVSGWTYTGANGENVTGWDNISGTWYYMNNSGVMQIGWVQSNGTWYYMNNSGAMQTGWVQSNGTWYYMNNSGAMQIGWVQSNGTWYYMSNSGAMQTGWVQSNGTWYYMSNSGAMQTGWLNQGGQTYYLNSSGAMQNGTQEINGNTYTFNNSGELISTQNSNSSQVAGNTANNQNGSRQAGDTTKNTNSNNTQVNNTIQNTNSGQQITSNENKEMIKVGSQEFYNIANASLLQWTNKYRVHEGLSALTENSSLTQMATWIANGNVKYNVFSDTLPNGQDVYNQPQFSPLITNANYEGFSENLAQDEVSGNEVSVKIAQGVGEQCFFELIESAPHKANILNAKSTQIGISTRVYPNGNVIMAQEFGTGLS